MRDTLIEAAFLIWQRGQRSGLRQSEYDRIDRTLTRMDGQWTDEERRELKRMISEAQR